MLIHKGKKPILTIKLGIYICCFRNSIRIQEYSVSWTECQLTGTILDTFHACKNKARTALQIFKAAIRMFNERWIVSGISKLYISRSQIQNSHPCSNEHSRFIIFAKLFVSLCENLIYSHASFRKVFDDCFSCHHKHRCRYSLARNIRRQKCYPCIANLIEIVEVTADFFGCDHLCVDTIIIAIREAGRKYRKLNLLSIFQFIINTSCCFSNIPFERGNR